MVFAFSKSPFWMESTRACTVSLLFILLSFKINKANSKQMGRVLMVVPYGTTSISPDR
jgi:hypothetical protein